MQAEHSRGSGFIVSPLSRPLVTHKPKEHVVKPKKKPGESVFKKLPSIPIREAIRETGFIRKRIFTTALSASAAVCSVMIFCNFFTIGTAIYRGDDIIAFSAGESDYYSALSAAKSYAEENASYINTDFKTVPALTLRSKISTSSNLRDKLLLSSPSFSSACTLYSGNTAVFSAESEDIAKKVVAEYVSDYSMNGDADVESKLTYKTSVMPKKEISGKAECSALLNQSGDISVISVVNTCTQKEIPFETETHQDPSLYVGETVTVSEGKAGSSEIESETIYKNGTEQSSKVVSEKVIAKPVAAVVRVGTKPKNVLDTGLFYPLQGRISSNFGARWGRMHEGMDIAVPVGTPVKAAECGTVSFAGVAGGYGNFIKIDHGGGVVTAYAHLSKIEVEVGQTVTADTQIALSGNTGRSTGPHLHFEVVKNDTPVDPGQYLKER